MLSIFDEALRLTIISTCSMHVNKQYSDAHGEHISMVYNAHSVCLLVAHATQAIHTDCCAYMVTLLTINSITATIMTTMQDNTYRTKYMANL
jgi:hypothetical protein